MARNFDPSLTALWVRARVQSLLDFLPVHSLAAVSSASSAWQVWAKPVLCSAKKVASSSADRMLSELAGVAVDTLAAGHTLRLSPAVLAQFLRRPTNRVTARTVGGRRVCLAGLVQGVNEGTFPGHFLVGDALASDNWVGEAQEEQQESVRRRWVPLEFHPRAIVFSNGFPAGLHAAIGLFGDEVTVLAQARSYDDEATPCADLHGVRTPSSISGDDSVNSE